jgi:ubiquinol-cytochrome c reductase subunit 9
MDSTPRRSGGGVFEGIYKLIMRRNSIYVTFVIAGAFAGERVSFFILGFFFMFDCL